MGDQPEPRQSSVRGAPVADIRMIREEQRERQKWATINAERAMARGSAETSSKAPSRGDRGGGPKRRWSPVHLSRYERLTVGDQAITREQYMEIVES